MNGSGQSGPYGPLTLHWDGDTLLYTTDQNGAVTDIKIETYGDVLPSGGTWLYQRNLAGHIIGGVASDGSYLGTSLDDPYQNFDQNGNSWPDAVAQYGEIAEPASDGIWDGVNVIQGVRSYDPTTSLWTTPDAYEGEVHDPASQKPFMWNRNNPFAYSDPSGFDPTGPERGEVPGEEGLANVDRALASRGIQTYRTNFVNALRNALKIPANAPKITSDANRLHHMFALREDHVQDSAINRAMLQKVASDPANKVEGKGSPDGETVRFEKTNAVGTWYADVRNGEIINGGFEPAKPQPNPAPNPVAGPPPVKQ